MARPEVTGKKIDTRADETFLTAAMVRSRYGEISDMSLWRWLHSPSLCFPKPFYINGYRYWKLRELIKWERSRMRSKAA
jgi:hypothetical protein